jgi:hypothetical protein
MSKRKYTKHSPYWDQFNVPEAPSVEALTKSLENNVDSPPVSAGEAYYVSEASAPRPLYRSDMAKASYERSGGGNLQGRRGNRIHKTKKNNRFTNIENGMLPYSYDSSGINVRDTIELCQKAYANIAVFRNAIDVMSEFANSNVYLEGGSSKSRDFVSKWFEKVNLWNLKDQYFREYYRSGNIFLYRVDGKFSKRDFNKLTKVYGSTIKLRPGTLPVKYILLNPFDITAKNATSFGDGAYQKLLSQYDLERLRHPTNEYDQEVFDSLDEDIRGKIEKGSHLKDGVNVDLDPEKLIYSFYKKQDYEPFAVPFGYPVLDDINFKLELKKIDQAICRTIENVILLITMGAEPDKGGINPRNMEAMQSLFLNESVGRVLVSDFTTKAQFIIPDISKVVGPSKYEVINNDIREGLQNVIVGDERYSNTQVKAKIFLERLKESRNAFIFDFLQPQIKTVCKNMGFRKYPTAKFEEIDLKDEVQLQRVATRLMELGVITPEQGMVALKKGVYPNPEDLSPAQEKYVEEREKGYFNPVVGGVPMVAGPEEEVEKASPAAEVGRPTGTKEIPQEPATASELYSRENIQQNVYATEKLRQLGYSSMRKHLKKKRLTKSEKVLIDELCEAVVISEKRGSWDEKLKECISDQNKIESLGTLEGVRDISLEHGLSLYSAALLYHGG